MALDEPARPADTGEGALPPAGAAAPPRRDLVGHAAIVTTTLLWGSLIPLIGILLRSVDPFALSAFRYTAASLVLGGLLAASGRTSWLRRLPPGRTLALGMAGIGGFTTLYTLGIAFSDPGAAIVVNAATPVVSAIFAALVYRVPLEKGVAFGFLLALVGSVIASLGPRHGLGFRGGEFLIVLSAVCWAWYSINAQRWLGALGQSQLTAATMGTASLGLWLIYLAAGALGGAAAPSWPANATLLLLVFVTLGATLTGVSFWNVAVARLGVVIPSLYLSLLPVIGMLTAAALGTPPTPLQLLGGAIVSTGIVQLHLRRLRRHR